MTTTIAAATKTCSGCDETLPLDEFDRRAGSGRPRGQCKECRRDTTLARKPEQVGTQAPVDPAADEARRARHRNLMRRRRANDPQAKAKIRAQQAVYNAALRTLRERHRAEFDELLAHERRTQAPAAGAPVETLTDPEAAAEAAAVYREAS